MARSKAIFAVQLKSGPSTRLRLGVGYLVDQFTDEKLVTEPMSTFLEEMAAVAQKEAVSTSRSQGVARTILTEIEPTLARVRVPLAYAPTLNRGRAKGAKMPSPNDPELRSWAASHGWTGRLFVLARAIQRRGIRGRFFMRKARSAVRRAMPEAADEMGVAIEKRFEGR